MTRSRRLALLPLFLALLLPACGGGGGGVPEVTGPTLDVMAGEYRILEFLGAGSDGIAAWGAMEFDGEGALVTGGVSFNLGGTTGGAPYGHFTYEIGAGNQLTWSQSGNRMSTGGVSASGDTAILGFSRDGSDPGIHVLLKTGGTYSTAMLDGAWHFAAIFNAGGDDGAFWGSATFDGVGGVTTTHARNNEGNVDIGLTESGDYTVAADGSIDLGLFSQRHAGTILAGGDLIVVAGGNAGGDVPILMVLLRQTTGADTSLLVGDYHYVRLQADWDGVGVRWTGEAGVTTADGAGTGTRTGSLVNEDGAVGPAMGGTLLDYSVGDSGAFKSLLPGGSGAGGVSPDGRFAVLAGGASLATEQDPQLWILMR